MGLPDGVAVVQPPRPEGADQGDAGACTPPGSRRFQAMLSLMASSGDVDEGPLLGIGFRRSEDLPGAGATSPLPKIRKRTRCATGLPSVQSKKTWGRLPVRSRMCSSTAAIALGTAELSIRRMRYPCR